MLASLIASGSAEGTHGSVSPYVFGGVTLGVLIALLVVTWLIKVER